MEDDEALERAIESLKKHKIRWVHSTFVDIRGLMQDVVMPAREFINGSAFKAGIGLSLIHI